MNSKNTQIDLAACSNCVSFNIRKAMRAVSQHYDQILAPSGLRNTQFAILTVLRLNGNLAITELADQLVMDRTTLTRNLKPLEKDGYLRILPGLQDRRSRLIELTAAGKKVQNNAIPHWQKAQDEMINFLGKSNTRQFISDLRIAATSHKRL
ncbi:MAG: MarR family winged helix-turn-helix transcriptional regulator [Thiohalomonadales bacterium]